MNQVRVIQIKQSVMGNNDARAAKLREELREQHTFLLNLMSAPGSGKTTTVLRTIEKLRDELRIGVIEADIDSTVDADRIHATGIPVIQLRTGGLCHLEAEMTQEALSGLDPKALDLVILENVGNLVCPAEFDTGAAKNVMLLSVPEGDDKPLKYPLMFSTCQALIINKIDTIASFDFDMQTVKNRVKKLNPDIVIFEISAKTGQGMLAWTNWLRNETIKWNQS